MDRPVWLISPYPDKVLRPIGNQSGLEMDSMRASLKDKGVRYEYLHTSGHAKLEDMKKLVDAMAPEMVVLIHSFHPDKFKDYFSNVRLLDDGEVVNL